MKIDDAPLTCYLVKHLQPLTEADPTLLANYVVALLKNNKPKKDLQKLCIDQLFDFLGEGTKAFVLKLFHALEDGTIQAFHEEHDSKDPIISSTVPAVVAVTVMPSGENTESKISPQHERITGANIGVFSDGEEEGTDDEDDDRNHKHRRRVSRSRSVDRDTQDEDERAPYRKRNRPAENGQQLRETDRPTSELRRGVGLIHTERDGPVKNERRLNRDHNFGASLRINGEGNQRGGSRGGPTFRGDGPGSRFEHQNGSSRGVLGRGRGVAAVLWEQRCAPFDGSDFNAGLLPSGPPPATLYSGRAIPGRGNPPHPPWAGYGHHPGIANGALDQTLPLNAGMPGPRGVSISAAMGVGVNIGIGMPLGRSRCPDFEERGYCLRGDLCPMEHGANRIVVEDVQSLSQFNLPVALPSGRSMAVGSMSVSGPSTAPFSPNLGLPSRSVRETNMPSLDEPSIPKGTLASNASSEPDLYDPDQPLWNREQPDVADGMKRLPSFRKGQEENEWDGGAVERRLGRMADEGNPERYGRSTTSGGSQGLAPGQSVWDRIGPVDRGESKTEGISRPANSSGDGLPRLKVSKKDNLEDHEPHSKLGKWEGDNDGVEENPVRAPNVIVGKGQSVKNNHGEVGLRPVDGSNYSSRGGGGRNIVSGNERAQRTLYVSCIPNNNNKKELLMNHFQKFGDIMDIRIPAHSDRAFVQFSQREDAEAALMSPDAVMGNRFIRLSWANRDSIQDPSGEGSMSMLSNARSVGSLPGTGPVLLTQTSLVRGEEKAGAVSALESNTAESVVRLAGSNGLPSSSAVTQKKQEELEHMKEEIRRKQEELAQKRDDFRRKLNRLSKQGSSTKTEPEVDQPSNKRLKLEKSEGASNGSNKQSHVDVPALPVAAEKNTLSVDQTAAGSSLKPYPGISHPSPRGLRVPFPRPSVASSGSLSSPQWGPSRYKLDNRTTVFRILPPLPEGLLDITILKEHFSSFGELLNLELEDGDQKLESNLTGKSVVRITFGSRRAAEHAFVQGRWFQGTSLQVVWVNPSVTPTSNKQGDSPKEIPLLTCNPRVSTSGGVNKEGTEDGRSPREQERSVAENVSAEENVQVSSKFADEGSQSGHGQVVASHPHSDLSTKLDGADGDSSGISKVVASI